MKTWPRIRESIISSWHGVLDYDRKIPVRKREEIAHKRAVARHTRLMIDSKYDAIAAAKWQARQDSARAINEAAEIARASPPPLATTQEWGIPQIIYVEREKKGTSLLTKAVAVLAVLVFFGWIVIFAHPAPNGAEEYGDASAYMVGQTFVKKHLKNPDAAIFDRLNSEDCFHYERKDGLFEVGGTVRSTNSFGAIVPSSWRCVVHHDGRGDFSLKYLKVGDQEDRPYPTDGGASSQLKASKSDRDIEENFIGLTKWELIRKMGQPIETKSDTNPQDGKFEILIYDNSKKNLTLFTIWENDGRVSSGSFHGKFFVKSR